MATAAYTISRRLGLDPDGIVRGTRLPLLPVVALQSQTALNDLPLAALVAAAAALLMRRCPTDLALAAVAVGLALATKVTGLLALPPLAVLAWLTWKPRWRPVALAGAAAVAGGSVWYAVNLHRTGELFGRFPSEQRGNSDPVEALGRVLRMSINLLEVPGAQGRDRLVFVIVGAALLGVGLVAWRRGRWSLGGASQRRRSSRSHPACCSSTGSSSRSTRRPGTSSAGTTSATSTRTGLRTTPAGSIRGAGRSGSP